MVERNTGVPPDSRIEFRIGIHIGDVVEESDGDLMGDGLNIAARLQGISEVGGICLSEDAYRQVRDKIRQNSSILARIARRTLPGRCALTLCSRLTTRLRPEATEILP